VQGTRTAYRRFEARRALRYLACAVISTTVFRLAIIGFLLGRIMPNIS
jgi:hypothetical protein